MDQYRCHQIYVNTKTEERVEDTVELLPYHTKITFMYSANLFTLAAADLTGELIHPNTESSFTKIGEKSEKT